MLDVLGNTLFLSVPIGIEIFDLALFEEFVMFV